MKQADAQKILQTLCKRKLHRGFSIQTLFEGLPYEFNFRNCLYDML